MALLDIKQTSDLQTQLDSKLEGTLTEGFLPAGGASANTLVDSPMFTDGTAVSIGTASPDSTALFEIQSTSRGSIPAPVMTETQRDAITTPATGLTVYNSTTNDIEFFNGTSWQGTAGGADGDGIYDGDGTVPSTTTATLTDTIDFASGSVSIGSPSSVDAKLHIKGDGTTSATQSLRVEDNAGNPILTTGDDRLVGINVATPLQQIDVVQNGGTSDGAGIRFRNSSGTKTIGFESDGGSGMTVPALRTLSNVDGRGMWLLAAVNSSNDVVSPTGYGAVITLNAFEGTGSASNAVENARVLTVTNGLNPKLMIMPNGNGFFADASSFSGDDPTSVLELWAGSNNKLLINPYDVTTDGQLVDSPSIVLRGKYDSDETAGITSADFDAKIQHIITAGGSSPASRVDFNIDSTTVLKLQSEGYPEVPEYTVATLPAVGSGGGVIAVTDETGGYVLAFSDGTDWRRVTDRAIVS